MVSEFTQLMTETDLDIQDQSECNIKFDYFNYGCHQSDVGQALSNDAIVLNLGICI